MADEPAAPLSNLSDGAFAHMDCREVAPVGELGTNHRGLRTRRAPEGGRGALLGISFAVPTTGCRAGCFAIAPLMLGGYNEYLLYCRTPPIRLGIERCSRQVFSKTAIKGCRSRRPPAQTNKATKEKAQVDANPESIHGASHCRVSQARVAALPIFRSSDINPAPGRN